MIQFYLIKFSLESNTSQDQILQFFKSRGDEAVQASDGLCVKTGLTQEQIESALKEKSLASGVTIQAVSAENKEALDRSVKAFIDAKT